MILNLFLAVENHGGEGVWNEYVDLITDPAHIMLELTLILIIDVIIGMLAWPFIKKWIKKHDERKHAHRHCDEVHQDTLFD